MSMTVSRSSGRVDELSGFLVHGLSSLDIRPEERRLVMGRYEGVGRELDRRWADRRAASEVYPQGSFKLGTVTRRVSDAGELDIDLVALLDLSKDSISQAELKAEVGEAVQAFAGGTDIGGPRVNESDRCWTLTWQDMHMDVLPALIDRDDPGMGILITDKSVARWQCSNPRGYAAWFEAASSRSGLEKESREVLAERTEIEPLTDEGRKTRLQRVVQLLKRHRDIYFVGRTHRVSSIVITTLATRAYSAAGGGAGLVADLAEVVRGMPRFVANDGTRWLIPNPVQRQENFADYWEADSKMADAFFEWMTALRHDLGMFEVSAGVDQLSLAVERSLGKRVAEAGLGALAGQRRSAQAVRSMTSKSSSFKAAPNTFAGGARGF